MKKLRGNVAAEALFIAFVIIILAFVFLRGIAAPKKHAKETAINEVTKKCIEFNLISAKELEEEGIYSLNTCYEKIDLKNKIDGPAEFDDLDMGGKAMEALPWLRNLDGVKQRKNDLVEKELYHDVEGRFEPIKKGKDVEVKKAEKEVTKKNEETNNNEKIYDSIYDYSQENGDNPSNTNPESTTLGSASLESTTSQNINLQDKNNNNDNDKVLDDKIKKLKKELEIEKLKKELETVKNQ